MISTSSTISIDFARNRFFARIKELGIDAQTVPYPAHKTVEECKALRGNMTGTFTKNLLLKDKKGRHFLISVHEDRLLDLKSLHKHIGASGRLTFASVESVTTYLGVKPGALTPLGLVNDLENKVTPVIDASLLNVDQVNFHPLIPEESLGLHPDDLLSFIRSCNRKAIILDFDQAAAK